MTCAVSLHLSVSETHDSIEKEGDTQVPDLNEMPGPRPLEPFTGHLVMRAGALPSWIPHT